MIKVGIVGASGYGGGELFRWLTTHPEAKVVAATSKTYAGQPVGKAFGGLAKSELVFADDGIDGVKDCDVVFLAASDTLAMSMAGPLLDSGCKVIDLSACFRFEDVADYQTWYGEPHKAAAINEHAAYGLPELHRDEIRAASLIGNPGCYTTASILALAPAMKAGMVELDSIVINGISGVSGAGRSKFGLDTHFSEMNENAWAYNVGGTHRHTGELEQELSKLAGTKIVLSFTPHIVPMTRGILATCVANLTQSLSNDQVLDAYRAFYASEPFVHISSDLPRTKHTLGSNMCEIGIATDPRTNRLTVIAALDNLGKGMAGQAVQNMNIMFGIEETTGLKGVGLWP